MAKPRILYDQENIGMENIIRHLTDNKYFGQKVKKMFLTYLVE